MGDERGLANAELVPDLGESVPRNSNIVGLVRRRSHSHLGDDVSVLILSGGGLDLSLSVPDGGDVVHA